jgi:hypothetical protein
LNNNAAHPIVSENNKKRLENFLKNNNNAPHQQTPSQPVAPLETIPEGNNENRGNNSNAESVSEVERMAANAKANAEANAEGPSEENIRKYENTQIKKLIKNSERQVDRKFTDEELNSFNKLPIDKKLSYLTKRNKEVGVDELNDYMTELLGFAKLNNVRKARSMSPPPQIPFLSSAKGGSRKVSPVGPAINMRVKRAPKKKTRKMNANAKAKRKTRKL